MNAKINGQSWHRVNLDLASMGNVHNANEQVTRLGTIAEQLTENYEANRSHGWRRAFKGLFSLGINEIWRLCNTLSYNSDMKQIGKTLQNLHTALAPKLEVTQIGDSNKGWTGMQYLNCDPVQTKIGHERVTVERKADGSGTVTFLDGEKEEVRVEDCDKLRAEIEHEAMRHSKYFSKTFIKGLIQNQLRMTAVRLESHYDSGDNNSERDTEAEGLLKPGQQVNADLNELCTRVTADDKAGAGAVRRAWNDPSHVSYGTVKSIGRFGSAHSSRFSTISPADSAALKADPDKVIASEQNMAPHEAATLRLRNMLADFYEERLGIPAEVGRTFDVNMAAKLAIKVLDGEITDGKRLRTFLDKGSKGVHIADVESRRILSAFAEVQKSDAADMVNDQIDVEDYEDNLESKAGRFIPKGTAKEVHDFVADLILNQDPQGYDANINTGVQTGARLRRLIDANVDLVARMMADHTLLDTLDDDIREVVENTVLAPIEARCYYQRDVAGFKRHIESELKQNDKNEFDQRRKLGTRDALVHLPKDQINAIVCSSRDVAGDGEMGDEIDDFMDGNAFVDRAQVENINRTLDLFGTIEADINKKMEENFKKIQSSINLQLTKAFKKDDNVKSLTSRQLADTDLNAIQKSYAKEPELDLVKETLSVYFEQMPAISKRQMLAAQVRHCLKKDEDGKEAGAGTKLGALLKGAGPVMQKMLQGLNPAAIEDEALKEAIADMKDNLAPIHTTAIKAYLYDIIAQDKKANPTCPIESIKVERSLGQASVGQALLCTLKRQGQMEQSVVIKLLRPDANLSARREHDIFKQVAQKLGNGMEATFKGRYKSIKAELDLSAEAQNAERALKVYDYGNHRDYQKDQPFTNVHSAGLSAGFRPMASAMVQQCAEGDTLKKVLAEPLPSNREELEALRSRLVNTNASLTNLAYIWAQEGLFGAGFYHGDLHEGNIIIDQTGQATVIDWGNATTLDKNGRTNVIRVVAGMAACDTNIFMTGYRNLLQTDASLNAFDNNRAEIEQKLRAVLDNHRGLNDTAQRLDVALKILQLDYNVEVPAAVHNFLESQRRLADAMSNAAKRLQQVEAALGVQQAERTKPTSMMACLIDVVKANVGVTLLRAIGMRNAKSVAETMKQDVTAMERENLIQV